MSEQNPPQPQLPEDVHAMMSTMSRDDAFTVLGLQPTASPGEVRHAYALLFHRCSRRHDIARHPEARSETAERLLRIRAAYAWIGESWTRAREIVEGPGTLPPLPEREELLLSLGFLDDVADDEISDAYARHQRRLIEARYRASTPGAQQMLEAEMDRLETLYRSVVGSLDG